MTTPSPGDEPDIPVREIDDVRCTTRAGIAALAGWKPGNSVNVRAKTDPDFPVPLKKVGRDYWYPLAGDHGVEAFLEVLAARKAAKKPPPVKPGDPDDLLHDEQAADALSITVATLWSYARYSKPFWSGQRAGRPLLPNPDVPGGVDAQGIHRRRGWYRRTLAAHQAARPGPGTGAGAPRKATTRS